MRNPLRSEAEAFRFLIAVIVGALVIIGAAYVNTWLGVLLEYAIRPARAGAASARKTAPTAANMAPARPTSDAYPQ